eukprot:406467-Amphidinium_carterae.1
MEERKDEEGLISKAYMAQETRDTRSFSASPLDSLACPASVDDPASDADEERELFGDEWPDELHEELFG